MLERLVAELDELLATASGGGGERYVERHRERGKLLARERIELLLDRDSPFLELQPFMAWHTDFHVGASQRHRHRRGRGGRVRDRRHRPDRARRRRATRSRCASRCAAQEIALVNRLPLINLVESGGADLPTQADAFIPGGRDLPQPHAAVAPAASRRSRSCSATPPPAARTCRACATTPCCVEGRAKVFLGGPPLVKMATGEEADDEELGGAEMHARVSGLADYLAVDEPDALRLGREIVRDLNWRKLGPAPTRGRGDAAGTTRRSCSASPRPTRKVPFDPREVLARVVDGSRFDEFKPLYGTALRHRLGLDPRLSRRRARQRPRHPVLRGGAEGGAVHPARQPDATCRSSSCRTRPASWSARDYEQGGIIKDGAKMINAVVELARCRTSRVMIGGSLRRRQLRHVRARRTTRASCSRGPTRSRR